MRTTFASETIRIIDGRPMTLAHVMGRALTSPHPSSPEALEEERLACSDAGQRVVARLVDALRPFPEALALVRAAMVEDEAQVAELPVGPAT